jgi:hypothetical protein
MGAAMAGTVWQQRRRLATLRMQGFSIGRILRLPEPRPTEDVDVIVEVTSRGRFANFEQRLRRRRFREDQENGIVCRWLENRWQGAAVPYAIERELPPGTGIAAVSPPFLVATKLEAFASRGSRRLHRKPRHGRHRQPARRAR